MATLKWRNAYLYWNDIYVTEGTAISISYSREWIEDTAYGDTNRTYQPGFADFEMTIRKHYDAAVVGMENDATANSPSVREFFLYPDRDVTTDYWYGSGYVGLDDQGGDMSGLVEETYVVRAASVIYHRDSTE